MLIHWISYYVNLQWGLEALGPMLLGSVLIGIQTQRACVRVCQRSEVKKAEIVREYSGV